jgi:hypothetical protein
VGSIFLDHYVPRFRAVEGAPDVSLAEQDAG